jgi:signal transduction histidine kinase
MPDPVWYRSLYWRFAIGFVALLATLLVVQGAVFLWMTGRMPELFRTRSSAQLANTIAADLAAALKEQPDLDLNEFITKNYARTLRTFVIAMRDCRFAFHERTDRNPPPFPTLERAWDRLGVDCRPPRGPGGPPPPDDRVPPPGRGEPGRGEASRGGDPNRSLEGFGRGGYRPPPPSRGGRGGGPRGPRQVLEFAPVHVDTIQVAMVAVVDAPPDLIATVRDAGPVLAIVAFGLLVAGTAIAALLVFRPASRRLRDLQKAAIALGSGETGVRASEAGGDEVTSLARTFNDMAARLEERSTLLDASNRTRGQLLADVSHELTTPLAAIRGYVETLDMPNLAIDDATRSRYLRIIHEETNRLEHIVGDLLDLAKLEGGGGTFKAEPVLVAQLFERIHKRHDQVLRSRDITLQTDVAEDASLVRGDQNRLEQALQNLVANAVRHTPEGGRVVVAADRVPAGVRLSVQDNGMGIPEEHLSRVFDRFYKVDVSRTGTALPSGSGLGLSIVQAIVTRHGGTVTASNPPGGGARFEIVLPDDTGPGLLIY